MATYLVTVECENYLDYMNQGVYDVSTILDCKVTKCFQYLNTFAQLFSIIQKKRLYTGAHKREKTAPRNKVLVIMMWESTRLVPVPWCRLLLVLYFVI